MIQYTAGVDVLSIEGDAYAEYISFSIFKTLNLYKKGKSVVCLSLAKKLNDSKAIKKWRHICILHQLHCRHVLVQSFFKRIRAVQLGR